MRPNRAQRRHPERYTEFVPPSRKDRRREREALELAAMAMRDVGMSEMAITDAVTRHRTAMTMTGRFTGRTATTLDGKPLDRKQRDPMAETIAALERQGFANARELAAKALRAPPPEPADIDDDDDERNRQLLQEMDDVLNWQELGFNGWEVAVKW